MLDTVLLIRGFAGGKIEFPFGLLHIGTATKKRGFEVEILDLHYVAVDSFETAVNKVVSFVHAHPDTIIGISALSTQYPWIKEFSLSIKSELPFIPIIVGGHCAALKELILTNTGMDYVCLREGEFVLPELMEHINKGSIYPIIPGLAYKQAGQIVVHKNDRTIRDLRLPDYSLINVEDYLVSPGKDDFFKNDSRYLCKATERDRLASIMFSRGCVGSCAFCQRHLQGYRQPPVDWCIDHIHFFYMNYGVKYFRFIDELFFYKKEWLDEFCKKIAHSNLDILFRIAGMRSDCINDDILKKLENIGCIGISYGVESGSQKILDIMNKKITVEINRSAIMKTIKQDIKVRAFYMIGYEGETKKTLRETFDFIFDPTIEGHMVRIVYPIPIPGTQLYRNYLNRNDIRDEERFIENDIQAMLTTECVLKLGDVNGSYLKKFRRKIFLFFRVKKKLSKLFPLKFLRWITIHTSMFELLSYCSRLVTKTKHIMNRAIRFGSGEDTEVS